MASGVFSLVMNGFTPLSKAPSTASFWRPPGPGELSTVWRSDSNDGSFHKF